MLDERWLYMYVCTFVQVKMRTKSMRREMFRIFLFFVLVNIDIILAQMYFNEIIFIIS